VSFLVPGEPCELLANDLMVPSYQVVPSEVAEAGGHRRRTDDVGEQDRPQLRRRIGGPTHADEFAHGIDHGRLIARCSEVFVALEHDQLGIWDLVRDVLGRINPLVEPATMHAVGTLMVGKMSRMSVSFDRRISSTASPGATQ
jgi:hypothetical protein